MVRLNLEKLVTWSNRDEDWKNTNSLFQRRFLCCRRPRILRSLLIDNTTGERSLFLDSSFFFLTRLAYFFRLKFQNFDSCLKSWHLLSIFFLFLNIYISANLDSYFLLHSVYFTSLTYVLCFQHVFTIGIILSATERHKHGHNNAKTAAYRIYKRSTAQKLIKYKR